METNQSFDEEFFSEPEIVLYNFKQVLFSLRWSNEFSQSY